MEINSGRKVLLIDDEEALLKNRGYFVKIAGYSGYTSTNITDGLEVLINHIP